MQFQVGRINPLVVIHRSPYPAPGEGAVFAVGGYPPLHDFVAKAVQRSSDFGIIIHHKHPHDLHPVAGGYIGGVFPLLEFLFAGVLYPQSCAAGGAGAMFPFGVIMEYLTAVEAGNDTFFRAPTYRFDNFGIGPAFLCRGQRWQFLACFDCFLLEFISRFHGVSN